MHLPTLVFDIETIADLDAGVRLHPQLADLSEHGKQLALANLRQQESHSDFPRLLFHNIVCLSGLWVSDKGIRLFSLSAENLSEKAILSHFFTTIEKNSPTLVSWNGSGFDLPVILYRAMQYDLTAPTLLDQGEFSREAKYNNYLNRYHHRHVDLMDNLSLFGASRFTPLDQVAALYGLPGKQGVDGYQVSQMVAEQAWQQLTQYCESDVLNTWLIYLRWLRLKGLLTCEQFDHWQQATQNYLSSQPQQQTFLANWHID